MLTYVTLEELRGRLYHYAAQPGRPVIIEAGPGNFSQVAFALEEGERYKLFKIYTGGGKYSEVRDMITLVVENLGGTVEEWWKNE